MRLVPLDMIYWLTCDLISGFAIMCRANAEPGMDSLGLIWRRSLRLDFIYWRLHAATGGNEANCGESEYAHGRKRDS
jgi:hypothetical protein